jgi:hypothetical protein
MALAFGWASTTLNNFIKWTQQLKVITNTQVTVEPKLNATANDNMSNNTATLGLKVNNYGAIEVALASIVIVYIMMAPYILACIFVAGIVGIVVIFSPRQPAPVAPATPEPAVAIAPTVPTVVAVAQVPVCDCNGQGCPQFQSSVREVAPATGPFQPYLHILDGYLEHEELCVAGINNASAMLAQRRESIGAQSASILENHIYLMRKLLKTQIGYLSAVNAGVTTLPQKLRNAIKGLAYAPGSQQQRNAVLNLQVAMREKYPAS